MGGNVQVVWEKFANYWEVEPRYVPLEGDVFHLTADRLLEHVDENTIGVVAVLGSTMDGSYEPVQEICAALDELRGRQRRLGARCTSTPRRAGSSRRSSSRTWSGTSGSTRVVSIQASGHKFGLVYPGVGWVLWRDAEHLPEDLVFHVNYLGGDMPTFALNFSRPGAQVVLQYFQFLRLGREGFRLVQQTCQDVAVHIARTLEAMPEFDVISDGTDLPGGDLHDEPRGHQVRRVRRLAQAARAGLAGARRTRCRPSGRTSPCCGSWSATASATTWPSCSCGTCARRSTGSTTSPARCRTRSSPAASTTDDRRRRPWTRSRSSGPRRTSRRWCSRRSSASRSRRSPTASWPWSRRSSSGLFTDLPTDLFSGGTPAWWPVPWLVLCGLLTGLTIRYLPGNGGPLAGVRVPRRREAPVDRELPGVVLAALTTLSLGAVLGPEAPLIAIGGGLGGADRAPGQEGRAADGR